MTEDWAASRHHLSLRVTGHCPPHRDHTVDIHQTAPKLPLHLAARVTRLNGEQTPREFTKAGLIPITLVAGRRQMGMSDGGFGGAKIRLPSVPDCGV